MYEGHKYVYVVRPNHILPFVRAAQSTLEYMGHKPAVQVMKGLPYKVSITIPKTERATFYLLLRDAIKQEFPQP